MGIVNIGEQLRSIKTVIYITDTPFEKATLTDASIVTLFKIEKELGASIIILTPGSCEFWLNNKFISQESKCIRIGRDGASSELISNTIIDELSK